MSVYNQRLLTPPGEEEEINPYRPVWRSFVIENLALVGVTLVAFVVFGFLRVHVSDRVNLILNILLIALPVALWLIFSVWRERFVPQPRPRLITVFVISALAANAVALPLINNVFQPEQWLPLGGAINRIIGYAFTVGIVQEVIKYAVVRFTVWPTYFRTRIDSVAYCAASALGYALVLNVSYLISTPNATPDVMAVQVFNNVALNLAASLLVSFGLAEVSFDQPTPFLLTITVAFAAFLNGVVIPLRSGLTNATFSLTPPDTSTLIGLFLATFSLKSSTPKPILSFVFSAAVLAGLAFVVAFLINNAERQAREAAASREVS
ncbi:MAG TPA: PrsW family glutamic-type intramembrane protease [Phototrophicaceae bacterium]|nr:PrsW family glutamic-type intramembrane protease [Phototrophicaceae bacterium]